MVTYRMIGVADENGETYECEYGTYNKKDGFVFTNPPTEECQWTALINALFHEDMWKLKKEPIKKMTLQEIEKELGYRVLIIDPEPEKTLSEKEKKKIEDAINFFNRLFGTNMKVKDYK